MKEIEPEVENDINIFGEHWNSFKKPWCNSFVLYFFLVIILLGGFGVIASIFSFSGIMNVTSNLSTYSIALLVPAIISILLSTHKSRNQVSYTIITVMVILIAALLLYFSHNGSIIGSIIASIVSTLLAWGYWVIANCDNIYLNDEAFHKKIANEIKDKHGRSWDEE
jgi:uncharacterized protein YacL